MLALLAAVAAPAAGLLWLVAVALVVYGIVLVVRGNVLAGVLLIVVGLAVGPGGWSIWG
jgi:hypothetical protein